MNKEPNKKSWWEMAFSYEGQYVVYSIVWATALTIVVSVLVVCKTIYELELLKVTK